MAAIIGANSGAALSFGDAAAAPSFGDAAAAREILGALQANPNVVSARLYRADGALLAQYRGPRPPPVEALRFPGSAGSPEGGK